MSQDLFEQAKPYLLINKEQIKLTDSLRNARGQRFGKILKETYYSISPQLLSETRKIIAETGKLTIIDIVKLSIQFNLHFKHCFDFLSDPIDPVIRSSLWYCMEKLKPMKLRQEILEEMMANNDG